MMMMSQEQSNKKKNHNILFFKIKQKLHVDVSNSFLFYLKDKVVYFFLENPILRFLSVTSQFYFYKMEIKTGQKASCIM